MKNLPTLNGSLSPTLDHLESVLRAALSAADIAVQDLLQARAAAASQLALAESLSKGAPESLQAQRCIENLLELNMLEVPCDEDLRLKLEGCRGWSGALACLIAGAPWQFTALPRIDSTPMNFWPTYVAALLSVPRTFRYTGQAALVGIHYLTRVREFVQLVESNKGSAAVQAALSRYSNLPDCRIVAETPIDLQELLFLRSRLLGLKLAPSPDNSAFVTSRLDRRLRVGFLCSQISDQPAFRFLLPLIESLDRDRFEVLLRPLVTVNSSVLTELNQRGYDIVELGEEPQIAAQTLRDSECDVLVNGIDLLASYSPVCSVALSVTAAINISLDVSGVGLPLRDSDLVLSWTGVHGEPSRFAAFYRQLALPFSGVLPVPGLSLAAATREWSRESMGLAASDVVYVSFAPFRSVLPETALLWARILKQVPESKLLVYSYQEEDREESALAPLFDKLDAALVLEGVDSSRLIVGNETYASLSDVAALMSIGNIYLGTTPNPATEQGLMALLQGLIPVCFEPTAGRNDHLPTLLNSLQSTALLCNSADAYVQIATDLGLDAARRSELSKTLSEGLASDKVPFDLVAFGEAWGGALEHAFDEYVSVGAKAFRKNRETLRLPAVENLEEARLDADTLLEIGLIDEAANRVKKLLAVAPSNSALISLNRKVLERIQRWPRLVDSLLCAVEQQGGNANHWFNLGRALRKTDKVKDAVQAFSTGLRLDPTNSDIWMELAAYAEESGDVELIKDVCSILKQLKPGVPEVENFLSKYE